ncbi:MAG: phosphatase PAP2 family protein [Ilumatobacteraceae bacterium]
MTLSLIVVLCGVVAALIAFTISASRSIHVDPVDPAVPEQAVRRSIFRHPRVERFLRARMDRKTAGGFLLTVSFLILFVVALTLGLLLDSINDHSWLATADKSVAKWGSEHGRSQTINLLKWITQLGSTIVISVVLLLTAIIDYARRRSREVFLFVAAVGVGQLILANVLKVIVSRDRPPDVQHLVVVHGYSFPSGHTTAAASVWLAVALVFGRDRSKLVRALLAGAAALIAVSVAASRALLGVHWLTDVIGGLALGWGWFMLVAIMFGGRAQRLGDPIADHPAGVQSTDAEPVARADHAVR